MNILDENVRADQLAFLRDQRVSVKKIGEEIGRKGMQDADIISLLHDLDRPTFFTLDADFSHPRLRHEGYCLVFLVVRPTLFADYVRRVLRHKRLNTKAKRMGLVIRVEPEGMSIWGKHAEKAEHVPWE